MAARWDTETRLRRRGVPHPLPPPLPFPSAPPPPPHALPEPAMHGSPRWVKGGPAEYLSLCSVSGGRAQAGAAMKARLDCLANHHLLPLSELFAVGQGSAAYHEGDPPGTFYAQSWL